MTTRGKTSSHSRQTSCEGRPVQLPAVIISDTDSEQNQLNYTELNARLERERHQRDIATVITREEARAWRVTGDAIERMIVQTDWDNDEAIAFLQHRLSRSGLFDRLEKAGVREGDEVRILGFAFDYEGESGDSAAYEDELEDEPSDKEPIDADTDA